ncbi:histidine kinase [Candidatus Desulforudis audaxviator]|uniref:histidine kinase n=1 Tax=Desulforudis audaxviator (strain MP104C) TaxID=477974 RepID=B1I1U3_DESAP|nr:signal transduction histidine kinase, LytS [Candidatus Desulforudis audaxviator MP104C]AZK59060.1 Autolysis histidine kinase LytS [Candidatus Desulforudis audaxviator]
MRLIQRIRAYDNPVSRILVSQVFIFGVLLLVRPGLWPVVLFLVPANGLALYFALRGQQGGRKIVTVKLDDQPIDPTFEIASETLPYMRRGLNEESAKKTAQIIQKIGDVPAVAITDRERVLAFIGPGCEKHPPGREIVTQATKEVIATGELKVVEKQEDLKCPVRDCECPLAGAVIVPLKVRDEVVGTMKLYRTEKGPIPSGIVKLGVGIGQLLGFQMELSELDRQAQLVTRAELDALRAQINPHFLFNTLNTIIMFSRTHPETARRLLIRLAAFFRHAFKRTGHFSTLAEELECVDAYAVLEKARFREKLHVVQDVDESLLDFQVPVLTLQPLVENAVKHGIMPKMGNGTVKITVRRAGAEMLVEITDDGVGVPDEILPQIFQPGFGSGSGVGLSNVSERLKSLFGAEYGLNIDSKVGVGTRVYFRIPLVQSPQEKGVNRANEAKSLNN